MANNQLLASDNFASGSLSPNWSLFSGFGLTDTSVVVTGSPNITEPPASSPYQGGQIWTSISTTDQICEVTVNNFTSSSSIVNFLLAVRANNTNGTGYYARIQKSVGTVTIEIQSYNGSSFTTLASTSSGTFAAGDVWTFQAAGIVLSLYKNQTQILFVEDLNYTSGSPAFVQTTNSTDGASACQISAWRCYSLVQQDGIWQKQGVVLPMTSSQVSPDTGSDALAVFQDTNAQILSGTVLKMWFSSGWFNGTGSIYYAESLDGKSWTVYSGGAVISGYVSPQVFKYSGTYYLTAQPEASPEGSIYLFTSTNGITWTAQGSILSVSGSGWDDSVLYCMNIVQVSGGTWYALYTGGSSPVGIGLATASSPTGPWTKYSGNPVLSASGTNIAYPGAIINRNGTWYMWVTTGQPGLRIDAASVRYESTNLETWANPVNSVDVTQMHEGLNTTLGQSFIASILDFAGTTYAYTISTPDDSNTKGFGNLYQITLAIGPSVLANLVQFNEDGLSQTASDSFTSGTGPLDGNWTVPTGTSACQIVSGNLVEPSATETPCMELYTAITPNANQYSEVTLHFCDTDGFVYPVVRGNTTGLTGYRFQVTGTLGSSGSSFKFFRGSGAFGQTFTATPHAGDVFRIQVVTGSDGFPIVSAYQNGFLIGQVEDYNNTYTSGTYGFILFGTPVTDPQISGWAGGNANQLPNYVAGIIDGMLDVLKQPLETLTQL